MTKSDSDFDDNGSTSSIESENNNLVAFIASLPKKIE